MAIFLRRDRWTEQPPGPVEIDPTHPLGQYAVVALTGAMLGTHDACGNEIAFTGAGIYTGSRARGRYIGHNGASSSVLYWRNKTVGNLGAGDFTVFVEAEVVSLASATSAILGKGDSSGGQWMLGGYQTDGDSLRFYSGAGAVAPTAGSPGFSVGRAHAFGAFRKGPEADVFFNSSIGSTTDTTAAFDITDSAHHLTLFSADFDGTTYDNPRVFAAEVTNMVILRGIGGIDVARALTDEPYAIYKPRTLRRYFLPAGPSAPTINSITASNITASGATITLGLTR